MTDIFESDDKIKMEIDEPPKAKVKGKHKKEMTPERKAQLSEQLKKARAISQAKRSAKAKEKK